MSSGDQGDQLLLHLESDRTDPGDGTRRSCALTPGNETPMEELARALESSQDYRVLRRLRPLAFAPTAAPGAQVGVFVDCETEGLGPEHKIIEVALLRFQFEPASGKVIGLLEPNGGFSALEDPGRKLDPVIERLTGLSNDRLKGQRIDDAQVERIIDDAAVIIAHNAAFDRPRFERRFPFFAGKPWACSIRDIDWEDEGVRSTKLEYLAHLFGFFFDGHRATVDCMAGLEVLSRPLPQSGTPALLRLLKQSACTTWRHFMDPDRGMNERFRALGYRWCGRERPSSWYRDFESREQALSMENTMKADRLGRSSVIHRITSIDRYSIRETERRV